MNISFFNISQYKKITIKVIKLKIKIYEIGKKEWKTCINYLKYKSIYFNNSSKFIVC